MSRKYIDFREVETLKDFYGLMAETRALRFQAVGELLGDQAVAENEISSLKNALEALVAIPSATDKETRKNLSLGGNRSIEVDLGYEIKELEKDIFYLERGEEAFLESLADIHPDFDDYVRQGAEALKGLDFNCFITDRDGTTNNYCGRYRSSVQSIYNSVFLTRFCRNVKNPIMLTSAPLEDFGLVDVSVNPERVMVYAASKGREFIGLDGRRRNFPVDSRKQAVIDKLNARLVGLVGRAEYEKFSLIGSGLQFKFGQTTIARQDITGSIPEDESRNFLRLVGEIVSDCDPDGGHLRIEDTGLDVEIILTIEDAGQGLKDFDKGDGVKYLDRELGLGMDKGPHLICGDTFSDVPMVEAALEKCPDIWPLFVTKDDKLAQRVKSVCPNSVIVPEPDVLVTILGVHL